VPDYRGEDGFCNVLDGGLHGTMHVRVGTPTNMGSIPFAANDPVFWLHHCNIDRLWASWEALGNTSPSLNRDFTLIKGDGSRIVQNVSTVMTMASMDYKYDRLEPAPADTNESAPVPPAQLLATTKSTNESANEPIKLGAEPVTVKLQMTAPAGTPPTTFLEHVRALPEKQRLTVVCKGLKAKAASNVVYNVYLDLPKNPNPEQLKQHYLGTVTFFDAVELPGHATTPPGEKAGRTVAIPATKVARDLSAKGLLSDKPSITIIPDGEAAQGAEPTIAELQLLKR
jgi:tyrosinase